MIKDLQSHFMELRILKGLATGDPPAPRLRRAGAAAWAERRKRTDLVFEAREQPLLILGELASARRRVTKHFTAEAIESQELLMSIRMDLRKAEENKTVVRRRSGACCAFGDAEHDGINACQERERWNQRRPEQP